MARHALPPDLAERLASALGAPVEADSARPVTGGDINQAWRVDTSRGPVFVKHQPEPPAPRTPSGPSFFEAEARGLGLLSPLPVPEVLAVLPDALALAWHEPAAPTDSAARLAGRALAHLHLRAGPGFGLDHDNFMGAIPQDNRPASGPGFASFFFERRVAPLLAQVPSALASRLERLPYAQILTDTSPRLIHGDLWAGNLLFARGGATFIDPAIAYGHPEQDLAMTRLFGGFAPAFFEGYREVHPDPFDEDLDDRLTVLTLYPLLIHVALFGGGYVRRVEAIAQRFAPGSSR